VKRSTRIVEAQSPAPLARSQAFYQALYNLHLPAQPEMTTPMIVTQLHMTILMRLTQVAVRLSVLGPDLPGRNSVSTLVP